MRRWFWPVLSVPLLACCVWGQLKLRASRLATAPALEEGAFAALGGIRSLIAEVIWFRADRLYEEGRYVEQAQLAQTLTFMEPQTPEVWSYAAWNLSFNISVMMETPEERWHWVESGIRLLATRGVRINPGSKELLRELAWIYELKLCANLDTASPYYRRQWREIVRDLRRRNAWGDYGLDPEKMAETERATGFRDWEDPSLTAIYWARQGGCLDIVEQCSILYRRNHPSFAR